MVRLLSSPRRRRRLLWMLAALLVVGSATGVVLLWPKTDKTVEGPTGARGWEVPAQPKPERLTERTVDETLTVAAAFLKTAVARQRVGDSWDLTAPSLKEGYTRAEWARGNIPVVPFPVGGAKWQLDYSFKDSVGLKVALFPRRGSSQPATVFLLDLRKFGKGRSARWLVESFQPQSQAPVASEQPGNALGLPNLGRSATGESRLSMTWLLVPFGIFSLIVLVPLAIGLSNWYRGSRAEREYLRSKTL